MSNINLLTAVQTGFVIFTKDTSQLSSGQQTKPYITPGISATSLYSRYIPTSFEVDRSSFVTEKEGPKLIDNQGGDELAKPHLDPEYLDNTPRHQVGHGSSEPSTSQSSNYEEQFSKLLDKFNHPHFNTTTVKSESHIGESVAKSAEPPEPLAEEPPKKRPLKRKIPNLKTEIVTKKVALKKENSDKTDFDKNYFDFTKL